MASGSFCYLTSSQSCSIFKITAAYKLPSVAAQALENSRLFLQFLRLTVDDVLVNAGLRVMFQRREGLVAEFGEPVAGACSGTGKQVAQEGGGAVSRGLSTEGIFRHAAWCASGALSCRELWHSAITDVGVHT